MNDDAVMKWLCDYKEEYEVDTSIFINEELVKVENFIS